MAMLMMPGGGGDVEPAMVGKRASGGVALKAGASGAGRWWLPGLVVWQKSDVLKSIYS
jgi:hypothetical protein